MSDLGLQTEHEHEHYHRRHRSRRRVGCLAVLLALVILVGGAVAVSTYGLSALKDKLRPPPDYQGSGTGKVLVQVHQGDNAADIGRMLVGKGVVKSQQAFTDAAKSDPKSVGIQVGYYQLHHKMSAKSALGLLINPNNLIRNAVTIPEGLRVDQIVELLAKKTKFSRADYERVLRDPKQLGLPSYANGNAEGYLFPATYELSPDATPRSILRSMVQRYQTAVSDLDLQKKAAALGYDVHDVMTVASIVQAEGRLSSDFPKIARVIYNRLKKHKPLQLDTSIVYIFKTKGKLTTTNQQRAVSSPYNTYRHTGLPPGPIAAPGEKAIRAALDPTPGRWLYFVTTNPSNGAMSFATTYKQHERNVRKFQAYCRTHSC